MKSTWIAVGLSTFVHGLILLGLFIVWDATPDIQDFQAPTFIQASLLQLKEQPKVPSREEVKKQQAAKRLAAEKLKQEQERIKSDRLKQEKQKQDRIAKEKQAREKQLAEAKKRAIKERELKKQKTLEQQKREAQQRLEQEALQKQAKKEQSELEQTLLNQRLTDEKRQLEARIRAEQAAQQAQDDAALARSYSDLIRRRIEERWNRPLSARNGMEALLQLNLIPTGEIIHASITRSSGNPAFDRSALKAVNQVGRFDELSEMPPRVFEENFRQFQLLFKPTDLNR